MNILRLIERIFNISYVKFLFVAGINTCFGYLIYVGCVYLLKNVYASVVVATIIAVLFNFNTYKRIVFKSKDNSRIFRFFGVYLFTMGIQMSLLKLLALAGITNAYIAGAILTLPMSFMSFLLMRKFVFNTVKPNTKEQHT
jgi:putative flippase GtrA